LALINHSVIVDFVYQHFVKILNSDERSYENDFVLCERYE